MLKRIKNSLQYRLGLLNEHFAVKRQVKAALREKAASNRGRSPGEVELYYWRKKTEPPIWATSFPWWFASITAGNLG